MVGKVEFAIVILCLGINGVLGSIFDPCGQGSGSGPLGPPGPVTLCRELGGFCFDDRCKNCTDGYIRTDLCGDEPREHRKCCLPGPPPFMVCCELYSDPHIRTFDGYYYDVQIPGDFVISKPCDSNEFSVGATFIYPYSGASWTKIFKVIITSGSDTILIEGGVVTVNGVVETLEYFIAPIRIYQDGPNIYVHLMDLGVVVCFNTQTMRLTVYVDVTRWIGKLCGLCANYNNDISDDRAKAPQPSADEKCPEPRTHQHWRTCKENLNQIMNDCPKSSVHRYLESCAYDMCAGGETDARFTLEAAREHCALDPLANLQRPGK